MPLLPVAALLAAGIFVALSLPPTWSVPLAATVAAAAIILALLRHLTAAALTACACTGIIAVIASDTRTDAERLDGAAVVAEADVIAAGNANATQALTVVIKDLRGAAGNKISAWGIRAMINVATFTPEIRAGQTIRFTTTLHRPDNSTVLPDQKSQAEILSRKGIRLVAVIPPDSLLDVADGSSLRMKAARWRSAVSDIIFRSPLKPTTKEFVNTIITGDTSALPDEMRDDFATAGLAHLLALSGLHVGIIATIIMLLVWPLQLTPLRILSPLIAIAILWGYAFITGLSPSVSRAVIMATILIAADMLQRRNSPANSLCLAAIVILLFDPAALSDISFQLSFLAVAGILIFSGPLNPVSRRKRVAYTAVAAIAVSVSAMLGTGLLSVVHFHRFPVYFLLANVVCAPLLPLIVGGAMLLTVAGAAGLYPSWVCRVTDMLSDIILWITHTVSTLPGANLDNIYLTSPAIAAWGVAIAAFGAAVIMKKRIYAMSAAGLALTAIIVTTWPDRQPLHHPVILSHAYRTDIIIPTADTLHIVTTAPLSEHGGIAAEASRKFAGYMGRRGIATLAVSTTAVDNTGARLRSHTIEHKGKRLLIADNDSVTDMKHEAVDMAIVCRGFRTTIDRLMQSARPGIVIISADIHPSRRKQYARRCRELGLTVHDLSADSYQPFSSL